MKTVDPKAISVKNAKSGNLPKITKQQKKRLQGLGCQCLSRHPIAVVRFFSSFGSKEWYVIEYRKDEDIYCGVFRGLGIEGFEEWDADYFRRQEVENGFQIKRCQSFAETPISMMSEGILEFRRVMLTEIGGFRLFNHDPVYRDRNQSIYIPIMREFKRYDHINHPKIIGF